MPPLNLSYVSDILPTFPDFTVSTHSTRGVNNSKNIPYAWLQIPKKSQKSQKPLKSQKILKNPKKSQKNPKIRKSQKILEIPKNTKSRTLFFEVIYSSLLRFETFHLRFETFTYLSKLSHTFSYICYSDIFAHDLLCTLATSLERSFEIILN